MGNNKKYSQDEIKLKTRRAFLTAGVSALLGVGFWEWLNHQENDQGIPWPFRKVLGLNEKFWRDLYQKDALAPQVSVPPLKQPRLNGDLGLDEDWEPDSWVLQVDRGSLRGLQQVSLNTLRSLPRTQYSTEFKCIEGWADKNSVAGVSFLEFIKKYKLGTRSGAVADPVNRPQDLYPYVALETPDRRYYVSLDMQSMLHPQTLLCYEMDGVPLTSQHGAPLRLYIPIKYGVKSLKRIQRIWFSDARPPDYWAERGYDWYAGL